jgi:hypothetical protein
MRCSRTALALRAAAIALAACGGDDDDQVSADAGHTPDAMSAPRCGHSGRLVEPLPVAWSSDLEVTAAIFDDDGSLVVATVMEERGLYCAGLARFAPDGTALWTLPFDESQPPPPPEVGRFGACPGIWRELALDAEGNILAVSDISYHEGNPVIGSDLMVRKLDADGGPLWTYYHQNGNRTGYDLPADVAADPNGDVLATGILDNPSLLRLSPEGALRWTWAGPAGDGGAAVESDPDGNAIVATQADGQGPSQIARIDRAGDETSVAEVAGAIWFHLYWSGPLALDAGGGPVVAPASDSQEVVKLSPAGEVAWRADVDALGLVDADGCRIEPWRAQSVAIGADGTIHASLAAEIDIEAPLDDFPEDNPQVAVLVRFSGDGEFLSAHLVPDGEYQNLGDLAVGADGTIALGLRHQFARLLVVAPLDP